VADRHRYARSLSQTLRTTAAAYGYTLAIATTISILSTVRGKPHAAELLLFVAGGLTAFAALELLLLFVRKADADDSGHALPLAGVLNCFSVPAALGASIGLAHALRGEIAWLIAPLAATGIYMVVVAAQVMVVERLRG
jgi:hypothetical protein